MRVLVITTKLVLHVAVAGVIFRLDACASRSFVQAFATYDIGDTLFERGHYAHMEHITPVGQEHLAAAPHNDDMPGIGRSQDNMA
jgi:hypothetical protein